ncbi:hypothetical protein MalM25_02240 [Planctomycetes bacterium MalM25]|nr:hypothetical protein MalM25_02240 [Planctomycetes bacterium MalM25]
MSKLSLGLLSLTLFSAVTSPCTAATRGVYNRPANVPGTPDGYRVFDISIDFLGQLFGQQLIVQLDSGSLYQDAFGSESPPNPVLFPVFPSLQSDTFVAMGGATISSSADTLVVGGSTEFPQSTGDMQFDTEGIDVAWAPAPGVVIEDRNDFMIARLTLSDDADGWVYLSSASGSERGWFYSQIHNGVLCQGICPEPTTDLMTLLGGATLLARRRCRSITLA